MAPDDLNPSHEHLADLIRLGLTDSGSRCPDIQYWTIDDEGVQNELAHHVALCQACRTALLGVTDQRLPVALPAHWASLKQRAYNLFPAASEGVKVLVIRLLEDSVRIVSDFGERLEPLLVRRDGTSNAAVTGRIGQELVTAQVMPESRGRVGVTFDIRSPNPSFGDISRVSLFRGQRELDSQSLRGGRVWFTSLPPDRYRVQCSGASDRGFSLDLCIEADGT